MITSNMPANQWACAVYHPDTGAKQSLDLLLTGEYSAIWTTSLTNELDRLAQGIHKQRHRATQIKGTNTIVLLKRNDILIKAKITYANFICNIRPRKRKHTESD